MKQMGAVALFGIIVALVGWVWWPTLQSTTVPASVPTTTGLTLRFGHNMPPHSAMGIAAEKLAQNIQSASNGTITVTVHPSGSLGNDLEMVEKARNGELDLLLVPTAKMSVPLPAMQYSDLPFYFPSPEILYRLLDSEPGENLLAKVRDIQLVGFTFWGNGFKQFTANRAIHGPDDLKNLKVRVMKSRLIMDQFMNLGAHPVPIEFRETRQALADGVVEAQENPLAAIVAMGIHNVQSHLTLSNHAYLAYLLAMSESKFSKYPPAKPGALVCEPLKAAKWGR